MPGFLFHFRRAPLRPNRAEVDRRLAHPGFVHPSACRPLHASLQLVHAVEGVEHVVQDAAGEEHVVDVLLVVVGDAKLEGPEALLENAEKAIHVLADTLQHRRKGCVVGVPCALRGRHKNDPLGALYRRETGKRRVLSGDIQPHSMKPLFTVQLPRSSHCTSGYHFVENKLTTPDQ